jgi:hypothetical protein
MPSGNPEQSAPSERGPEWAWTLAETLDGYAVEELTPAQAARLLRKRIAKRSEPQAPEHAPGQSVRNRARDRQPNRLGRSPERTSGPRQKDGQVGASDEKEEGVRVPRFLSPVSQLGASGQQPGFTPPTRLLLSLDLPYGR